MKNSNFSLTFNPNDHGDYLNHYPLKTSENMTNVCLFCCRHLNKHRSGLDEECVLWIFCISRCRWIVINCIPVKYRTDDYENNDFHCLLRRK